MTDQVVTVANTTTNSITHISNTTETDISAIRVTNNAISSTIIEAIRTSREVSIAANMITTETGATIVIIIDVVTDLFFVNLNCTIKKIAYLEVYCINDFFPARSLH